MSRQWKNIQQNIDLTIEDADYQLVLSCSGHDYPAKITDDPANSEPADFEMEYTIKSGERDGEPMTREDMDDLQESFDNEIYEAIMEQSC